MKLFHVAKDGGPKSNVTGFWLIEAKRLLSIALLRFADGSREEYHSHAFNSLSWVISGHLHEQHLSGKTEPHRPSLSPVTTRRSTFHRVFSLGNTWVLTIRGPWAKDWQEYSPKDQTFITMEHGRKVVKVEPAPEF